MITIYGIPNCNTVKKSLDWFNKNKIAYNFHNYKKEGITATKLKEWSKQKGWENIFNKKSATWRELDEAIQQKITSEKAAIDLMLKQTSIIKRPVIENDGTIAAIGFDEKLYNEVF